MRESRSRKGPGHGDTPAREEGGEQLYTTDQGNSWATANTTKISPYMGIDMGHYQLYSPEYTDSHGPSLPIGQSTNRTMLGFWTMAQAGPAESVA